jgi:hypothetical protein
MMSSLERSAIILARHDPVSLGFGLSLLEIKRLESLNRFL